MSVQTLILSKFEKEAQRIPNFTSDNGGKHTVTSWIRQWSPEFLCDRLCLMLRSVINDKDLNSKNIYVILFLYHIAIQFQFLFVQIHDFFSFFLYLSAFFFISEYLSAFFLYLSEFTNILAPYKKWMFYLSIASRILPTKVG